MDLFTDCFENPTQEQRDLRTRRRNLNQTIKDTLKNLWKPLHKEDTEALGNPNVIPRMINSFQNINQQLKNIKLKVCETIPASTNQFDLLRNYVSQIDRHPEKYETEIKSLRNENSNLRSKINEAHSTKNDFLQAQANVNEHVKKLQAKLEETENEKKNYEKLYKSALKGDKSESQVNQTLEQIHKIKIEKLQKDHRDELDSLRSQYEATSRNRATDDSLKLQLDNQKLQTEIAYVNNELQQHQEQIRKLIENEKKLQQALEKFKLESSSRQTDQLSQLRLEYDQLKLIPTETERDSSFLIKQLVQINKIAKELRELKQGIETFYGTKQDKVYLHLNEMLIRNLLQLDAVEAGNFDEIRTKRKETIKYAQDALDELNTKVT